MDASRVLGDFVASATFDTLGAPARERIRAHIKDCLGVALAAAAEEPARIVRALVGTAGARDSGASVIGALDRASPWDAAWVNGSLSHLLDFDDYGFGHPTCCLLPAALALGEVQNSSGQDLMVAMAVGWEMFDRLSRACRGQERAMRGRGIHPTGVYGPPAAAAAAGKVLGLAGEQVAVAFGLAASCAGGLTEQFGTWGKGVQAGNAARAGVLAAMLAEARYWGTATAIEGEHGLLSAFAGPGNADAAALTRGLGDGWAIDSTGWGIKPYPACGGTLRAIEAAIDLRRDLGGDPSAIERVDVTATESLLYSLHIDRPARGFEGKFSLRYCLAAALADGAVTVDSFSDESWARPLVQSLMDRTTIHVLPGEGSGDVFRTPVTVRTRDGATVTRDVATPKGHARNRLSYDEVTEKFLSVVSAVGSEAATVRLNQAIDNLEWTTVRDLVAAIGGVAAAG